MKKLYIHIIIVFTAFNVVSLNQFSRLPLLVAHYIDHWERDHSISLGAFIDMHYLGHDIDDHDDKKDKELPFKSFTVSSMLVLAAPDTRFEFVIHQYFNGTSSLAFLVRDQFLRTQFLSSLFRPPRISA